MKSKFIPTAIVGAVMLAGCNTLGGILDPYDNDRYDDRGTSSFERAAVDACSRQASSYGRVRVEDVRQRDRDLVDVRGRIETRDTRNDEFDCTYRSDRRIVAFRVY